MGDRIDNRVNLLALAWCNSVFAFSITYPFLPLYLYGERKYSMTLVGLIFPIMGLGRMLAGPVAGGLVDRFGRRIILVCAPLLRSLSFFILAFEAHIAAPYWVLAVTLFMCTFLGAGFQNASDTYVTDITTRAQRANAFARIRVGLNVGWTIGPAVGAFMARTPFSLLFAITGLVCLATVAIAFFWCPESVQVTSSDSTTETGNADESILRLLAKDHVFLYYLLLCFALFVVHSQLVSTLSIFATASIGVTKNQLGMLYSVNGAMVILFLIPVNRLLARSSLGKRLAVGSILYAIGYFFLGFSTGPTEVLICVMIFTAGEILTESPVVAVVSQLAPAGYIGRYIGGYTLIRGLSFAVGPFVGSLMFAAYGNIPTTLWTPVAACAVVAAYGFWRCRRNFDTPET